MRYLLDTCTFIWLATTAERLSAPVRQIIESEGTALLLSAVSAWEISLKHGTGRLDLPEPPSGLIPRLRTHYDIEALSLDEASTLRVATLPSLHRDPFDRLLVCQAIEHGLTILTPDLSIGQYSVRVVW
ncbi:MAG: type II toxin-antitoxin system VapC family toxin [Armatimonadetes bacterium]|nr:type II toxin-antitoxin system VapC family toxin [Armatimonadota bacterium]